MNGRTIGNLILMTLICVVIFVVFMAMRPAPAGETPIYGPDGKYQGSVFDYGKTQTYTDRNGRFTGSAVKNGNGTTSFFCRNGSFTGSGCSTSTGGDYVRRGGDRVTLGALLAVSG